MTHSQTLALQAPGRAFLNLFDKHVTGKALWSVLALALAVLCAASASMQMSFNLLLFSAAALALLAALSHSLQAASLFGLFFFCVKPVFWRLAYHLDSGAGTFPAVDLLRYSGGLFLGLICVAVIVKRIVERRPFIHTKLDMTLAAFILIAAASVFNPHTSLFLGMAGIERNIFPTLFLFFVGREVIQTERDYQRFIKIVTIFAIAALVYGLKHSLSGLWGFEQTYFADKYYASGLDGWLTIGIKGIEFRTFGVFFGYMEFTFTAALWGTLLLSHDYSRMGKAWRIAKWVIGALLAALLVSSLERTPMLMITFGLLAAWYVKSAKPRRKKILIGSAAVISAIIVATTLFHRQLEESGITKLQRLAEIADPASASSIQDRVDRMWKPTFRIIAANPLGVGSGYGSGTVASASAQGSQFAVQPHNEFMQKALEYGWLGAALFALALLLMFRLLLKSTGWTDNKVLINAAAGGCGILVAFILCGQVNLPFSGASGCFFWFTTGAIVSLTDRNSAKIDSHESFTHTDVNHEGSDG
ncbi:MAG: O-antigen ligase family protein [candidate division Zixibacteria bacterium]|nr:O-antigen ligase family protein [candidate division Zixibacteria bacterium]